MGWVRYNGEPWEITMRRMANGVQNALGQFALRQWDIRVRDMKSKHLQRLALLPLDRWEVMSFHWHPRSVRDDSQMYVPYRARGRLLQKWNDIA